MQIVDLVAILIVLGLAIGTGVLARADENVDPAVESAQRRVETVRAMRQAIIEEAAQAGSAASSAPFRERDMIELPRGAWCRPGQGQEGSGMPVCAGGMR